MKELWINDHSAISDAMEILSSDKPVIMVQLQTVYVLLAPPTRAGVQCLDTAKNRLSGKNYGTAIGSLAKFHAMAMKDTLPKELDSESGLQLLMGAFIRISIANTGFSSAVSRAGTHQGVLLDSPYREVFCGIEEGLSEKREPGLFNGNEFTAPLCTSANLSGDPLGSITNWNRAYNFGVERGIPLVLRSESSKGSLGSYPIFELTRDKIMIDRNGPGEEEIKSRLPQSLFN